MIARTILSGIGGGLVGIALPPVDTLFFWVGVGGLVIAMIAQHISY